MAPGGITGDAEADELQRVLAESAMMAEREAAERRMREEEDFRQVLEASKHEVRDDLLLMDPCMPSLI